MTLRQIVNVLMMASALVGSQAAIQNVALATPRGESEDALLEHARTLAQAGSFTEAERTARQYLARNETSAEGHFLLGYILFKVAKPGDSLQEYTKGAKYKDPGAAELKVVALDYVLLEDYADADHWLTQSVAKDPADAETWYYLGRAEYNENHFADATQSFARCLALDPRHVKAEANLGLALEGLHRTDEATAAYRTAISWDEHGAPQALIAPRAKPDECSPDTPRCRFHSVLRKAWKTPCFS